MTDRIDVGPENSWWETVFWLCLLPILFLLIALYA